MAPRNRFKRATGSRDLRKLFIIVVEGQTEQKYFDNFRSLAANVKVRISRGKSSIPRSALDEMRRQIETLKKDDLRSGDQAWVVFDQDNWGQELIEMVWDWSKQRPKDRGVGFSSPQFEWWLLLHFEDGSGASTQKEILSRLELHIPNYTKGRADQLPHNELEFQQAITRAKMKMPNLPQDFHGTQDILGGFTTVHFLVERILQAVNAWSK